MEQIEYQMSWIRAASINSALEKGNGDTFQKRVPGDCIEHGRFAGGAQRTTTVGSKRGKQGVGPERGVGAKRGVGSGR